MGHAHDLLHQFPLKLLILGADAVQQVGGVRDGLVVELSAILKVEKQDVAVVVALPWITSSDLFFESNLSSMIITFLDSIVLYFALSFCRTIFSSFCVILKHLILELENL